MNFADVKQFDKEYIASTYGRFPLTITRGKGSLCWDENGKEYIDLTSGIAVNTFGFCDDEWMKAVVDQLYTLSHTSNYYYTKPCTQLAKMLCERTGMKKVFFTVSGAEANECAIKAARKYAYNRYGDETRYIIVLKKSYHGRTIATLTATAQPQYQKGFGPMVDGFLYADAYDISEAEALCEKYPCCAIMFEVVQGEGGLHELSEEYMKGVKALAEKHDLLIIADEVQTGNGRTGKLYGYMNYDIKPDIVTTAKGIGGGLPLSLCMLGEKVENVFTPGTHGSTFGGNPVCCAGAVNILSRLDDGLLAEVREKSEYIRGELSGSKGVKGLTGLGLMIGIEVERDVHDIVDDCMERGVLVLYAADKTRLLPPLDIPWELLKKAVAVLKEVLAL